LATIIHGVRFTNMSRELSNFKERKQPISTGPTDLEIIILAVEKLY